MAILDLLSSKPEMYGLEIVESSGGRIKRGAAYVTLGRMEEKGYVESRQEASHPGAIGLPRRLYKATPLGLKVLETWSMVRANLAWEAR